MLGAFVVIRSTAGNEGKLMRVLRAAGPADFLLGFYGLEHDLTVLVESLGSDLLSVDGAGGLGAAPVAVMPEAWRLPLSSVENASRVGSGTKCPSV